MKKKFKIIFLAIFSLIALNSCQSDSYPYYEGESYLNFGKGTSAKTLISTTQEYKLVEIPFTVLKAVDGSKQVTVSLDKDKSTAVEGVDFDIVTPTVTLESGAVSGSIQVKVYSSEASPEGKVAVFTLSSASLPNAAYNKEYSLTIFKLCDAESFVGKFKVSSDMWGTFTADVYVGDDPNTLIIKDYIRDGYDIVLKYDSDTGVVTFDPQKTGYVHSSYGMIYMKPGNSTSSIDLCNRKLELVINYYVSAGSFGNSIVDSFEGL